MAVWGGCPEREAKGELHGGRRRRRCGAVHPNWTPEDEAAGWRRGRYMRTRLQDASGAATRRQCRESTVGLQLQARPSLATPWPTALPASLA